MSVRRRCAITLCVALLGSCDREPTQARVATADEAAAIVAVLARPLSPERIAQYRKDFPNTGPPQVCVEPKFAPPLKEERDSLAADKRNHGQRPIFERVRESVESALFGPKNPFPAPASWESRSLRPGAGVRLNMLLRQAVTANLPEKTSPLRIPAGVNPCSENQEQASQHILETDPSPVTRIWFSQPVIVGDTAFVERSSSCGSTCGSESVTALARSGRSWSIVAGKLIAIS